jgi:hypothetical protein
LCCFFAVGCGQENEPYQAYDDYYNTVAEKPAPRLVLDEEFVTEDLFVPLGAPPVYDGTEEQLMLIEMQLDEINSMLFYDTVLTPH